MREIEGERERKRMICKKKKNGRNDSSISLNLYGDVFEKLTRKKNDNTSKENFSSV